MANTVSTDRYVITLELGYGIPSFFDHAGIGFKSVLLKVSDLPASYIYTREEAEKAALDVRERYPYAVVEIHNCAWIDVEQLERKHRLGNLAAKLDEQYSDEDDNDELQSPPRNSPNRQIERRRSPVRKNYGVEKVIRRSIKDPETGYVAQSSRLRIVHRRNTTEQ